MGERWEQSRQNAEDACDGGSAVIGPCCIPGHWNRPTWGPSPVGLLILDIVAVARGST